MADEQIDIRIEIEGNAAEEAKIIARSLKDLGGESGKAAPKVKGLNEEVEKTGKEARGAAASTKVYEKEVKSAGNEAAKSAIKVSVLNRTLDKNNKKWAQGGRYGRKWVAIFGVLLIPAILDAVGALATLGSSLVAAATAGIAALAPLTGILIAYPGYLAAIGQGFFAFKLATMGIGDALKLALTPGADPKQLAAAMKNLTPEARKFVRVAATMRKPLLEVRKEVQEGMAPAFTNVVRVIRDQYIPIFASAMRNTTINLRGVIDNFATFLKQGDAQTKIGDIMRQNGQILRGFGNTALSVFKILIDLLHAAMPMLTKFARNMSGFFARISTWTSTNGEKLRDFFQKTQDITENIVKMFADLSMALFNIGKQGAAWGGSMGKSLMDLTAKFRAFTESVAGQEKITKWFETMRPIFDQLLKTVTILAKGLASVSMDKTLVASLRALNEEVLPIFIEYMQRASGQIIPELVRGLAIFSEILMDLNIAPTILRIIVGALEVLARIVNSIPEGLRGILGAVAALALIARAVPGGGMLGSLLFGSTGAAMGGFAGVLGAAAIAIAAIGMAAMTASSNIDRMRKRTSELADELLRTASIDSAGAMKDQIDDLNEALKSSQLDAPLFSADFLMNSDMWLTGIRGIGHGLKQIAELATFGAVKAGDFVGPWDDYSGMLDDANKALAQYNVTVNNVADDIFDPGGFGMSRTEDHPHIKLVQEIADRVGIDLTQGYDKASAAILKYYNVNYKAIPALRDMYNGLSKITDETASLSEKVDGFRTALESAMKLLKGNEWRATVVSQVNGWKELENAAKKATVGPKDFTKSGQWKFWKQNNQQLNNELINMTDRSNQIAADVFERTGGDVTAALEAYNVQYDKAVAKVAKGMNIAPDAAKKIVDQYMLTKEQTEILFNDPKLMKAIESGVDPTKIKKYLEGDKTVDITVTDNTKNAVDAANTVSTTLKDLDGTTYRATLLVDNLDSTYNKLVWMSNLGDFSTPGGGNFSTPGGRNADLVQGARAFGGPVTTGSWLVGELGPELFIGKSGNAQLIGKSGPEILNFKESGFVVPNHAIDAADAYSSQMNAVTSALTRKVASKENSGDSGQLSPISITVGDIHQASEFDVVKAIKKGIIEAERNRRERS